MNLAFKKKHVIRHFICSCQFIIPEEFKAVKLHSKGFFPEATVQDFPIRGKNV
jgi:hypothetical protein